MRDTALRKSLLEADFRSREQVLRLMRASLKRVSPTPLVHSVALVSRTEDLEFASLEYRSEAEHEEIIEWATDPSHPYTVTRETASRVFLTVR